MTRRSIDELVEALRREYRRLEPAEAYAAQQQGALIVDTRSPDEQREQGGVVPGAACYPLSVVLWRLDPAVDSPNEKPELDRPVIVICRHGHSSTLAASWLREMGFEHATDVVGGFEAWAAAGLPVQAIPAGD